MVIFDSGRLVDASGVNDVFQMIESIKSSLNPIF